MRNICTSVIGAMVCVLAAAGMSVAQAEDCRDFSGYFVSVFDIGPGCPDSSTIPPQCTHGKLYEDSLHTNQVATYEFSFTSQSYGGTADDPIRLVFAGDSVITETDGTIISGHDDGELYLYVSDAGQFRFQTRVHPYEECPPNEPCHPLSATSIIVAEGDLDLVTNTAAGVYNGQICSGESGCTGDCDCSGIDPNGPQPGDPCGSDVGLCQSGVWVCSGGNVVCDGVEPAEEICDGFDNDCDGATDEDCAG